MKAINISIVAAMLALVAALLVQTLPLAEERLQDGLDVDFEKNWSIRLDGETESHKIAMKGEKIDNPDNMRVYLSKKLEADGSAPLYLLVLTSNQGYEVYVGGEKYYEGGKEPAERLKNTSGRKLELIRLPADADGKEITILLDSSYGFADSYTPVVYVGTKAQLMLNVLMKQLPVLAIAVVQFSVGVAFLIFFIMSGIIYHLRLKSVFYLSLLAFSLSVWVIAGHSYIWGVWYNNSAFYFMVEHICGLSMPLFFVLAFYHSFSLEGNRVIRGLIYFLAGILIFAMLGQLTQTFDFYYSHRITALCILAAIIIFAAVSTPKTDGRMRIGFLVMIGLTILALANATATASVTGIKVDGLDPMLPVVLFIAAFTVLVIVNMVGNYKKVIMAQSVKEQVAAQIEYCRSLESITDEMELFRHDAKNHMLALGLLLQDGKTEEAKRYIAEAKGTYAKRDDILVTGNPVLDALLTEKTRTAKELGVDVRLELLIPADIPVSPVYWSILIGNILDNAIEACERSQNPRRFVSVKLRMENGMLFGSVANTSDDDQVTRKGNSFQTTKRDAGLHGKGLLSIRWAVEHYNGALEYGQKDGVFTLGFTLYGVGREPGSGDSPMA